MGKELRRLLLGLLLIAVPSVFIFLGVRGFVVRNAVVTAHLDMMEAPIAGVVESIEIAPGIIATEPSMALTLQNPRSDPARLDELAAEIERTLRSIEAHQNSLEWYTGTIADLQEQFDLLVAAFQNDVRAALEVVKAQIQATEARTVFLEAEAERAQRLQGSAVSEATLQRAQADLAEARGNLLALQAQARRMESRIGYLDRSLLVLENMDEAVAIAATIRELKVEKQKLSQTAAELDSTLSSLNEQLTSAQETFTAVSESTVEVPANSVVWELFAEVGATVEPGDPLFSFTHCDARLAQATVDDSTTELIRPDHPVTVYLYGEYEPIEGRVLSIYGSAAHIARSRSLAANVHDVGTTDAIVLIEIGPASDEAQNHRLCDIGRTAYVEFEGIGFLDPFLNRLW